MKKAILAAAGIILIGYTISEVVTYSDPFVYQALGNLTPEEISDGVATLTLASGEDSVVEEGAISESMMTEDDSFDDPSFEIMSVEIDDQ